MCFQHVETEQQIDVPSLPSRMKKKFMEREEGRLNGKEFTSMIVNEQAKYKSWTFIWAL